MLRSAFLSLTFVAVALVSACAGDVSRSDAGTVGDNGEIEDSGLVDAGAIDSGTADAGTIDSGQPQDAGTIDGGSPIDAGVSDDAGIVDAGGDVDGGSGIACVAIDAGNIVGDAGYGSCSVDGAPGECLAVSDCMAMSDTATAGLCPGPADIECCTMTPSTTDNPPVPMGWVLMQQAAVTAAMTTWAVDILNDPQMCPMFSSVTEAFGTQLVMARVEWHPPDFQNGVIHRGVTLYVPM